MCLGVYSVQCTQWIWCCTNSSTDAAQTHLLVLYKVIFFEWLISRRLASLRRNFECMPISFWSAKALDHLTAVWADLAG